MDTFTMHEFLTMIAEYSVRLEPVALIAYAVAVVVVILVLLRAPFASTFAAGVLALVWLWTGVVFNTLVFTALWPVGWPSSYALLGYPAVVAALVATGLLLLRDRRVHRKVRLVGAPSGA